MLYLKKKALSPLHLIYTLIILCLNKCSQTSKMLYTHVVFLFMSQSSRGLGQSGVMTAPVRWDAWPRLWGLCSAKAKQKPIDVYPPLGEKRCHLPSVYRHHFPTYLSFFPVTSLLPPRGRGSLEFGIGGPALKCPLPFSQVCTLGCPLLLPLS